MTKSEVQTVQWIIHAVIFVAAGLIAAWQFFWQRRAELKALEGHARKKRKADPSMAGSGPDVAIWNKTAAELSGTLTKPYDKTGMGLAIAGKIYNLPFRIELRGENRIFYSLTLPYVPPLKTRTFPVRCVSDNAIIGEDTLFILCPGTSPTPAVIRELAAHAARILMTIPFENEPDEDRPDSSLLRRQPDKTDDTASVPEPPKPVFIPVPEPVAARPEPAVVKTEPVAARPEPAVVKQKPAAEKIKPVIVKTEPVAEKIKPVVVKTEPVVKKPEPVIPEPGPVVAEQEAPPAPDDSRAEKAGELTPESLAEILFRSSLPGPAEKEYFASLTGRRVDWTGTVRMAYEISSDFVFGRVKGVKVQMDLCTVAGKYGRQTLRATAVFPPESCAALRASSNKTIRFRGTILKLESFTREVYLSEGELL